MTIDELIERLEYIRSVTGDLNVVSVKDVCGDDCLTDLRCVAVDSDKRGTKYAVLEFALRKDLSSL